MARKIRSVRNVLGAPDSDNTVGAAAEASSRTPASEPAALASASIPATPQSTVGTTARAQIAPAALAISAAAT